MNKIIALSLVVLAFAALTGFGAVLLSDSTEVETEVMVSGETKFCEPSDPGCEPPKCPGDPNCPP